MPSARSSCNSCCTLPDSLRRHVGCYPPHTTRFSASFTRLLHLITSPVPMPPQNRIGKAAVRSPPTPPSWYRGAPSLVVCPARVSTPKDRLNLTTARAVQASPGMGRKVKPVNERVAEVLAAHSELRIIFSEAGLAPVFPRKVGKT